MQKNFVFARRASVLSGCAMAVIAFASTSNAALAEECVMEDAGTSTTSTQGATSGDATDTACGTDAAAANGYATALGYGSVANVDSGSISADYVDGATALGAQAVAVGYDTIAVGNDARVGSFVSNDGETITYDYADFGTAVGADSRVSGIM